MVTIATRPEGHYNVWYGIVVFNVPLDTLGYRSFQGYMDEVTM